MTSPRRARSCPTHYPDVWALFTRFDASFADGAHESGRREGREQHALFQPILQVPLHGAGPKTGGTSSHGPPSRCCSVGPGCPTGLDGFDYTGGLGDIQLPTVAIAPRRGTGSSAPDLPSCPPPRGARSRGDAENPSAVVDEAATFGAFVLLRHRIAGRPRARRQGRQLHEPATFAYNLPNAWQISFDPTITYDARATSGNKWNVPVGLSVAKTTLLGKLPVKLSLGAEYSVSGTHSDGEGWCSRSSPVISTP